MGVMSPRRLLEKFQHGDLWLQFSVEEINNFGDALVVYASRDDRVYHAIAPAMPIARDLKASEEGGKILERLSFLLENQGHIHQFTGITQPEIIMALVGAKRWLEAR